MQIYTVLDKTMIGLITGSSVENGYYEQANRIPRMLLAVVTAMGTVLGPRIGKLFGEECFDEIRDKMMMAYRFVWFLGLPMATGLCAVAGHFVPWFLGEDFSGAIPILRVLSWLILIVGFSGITGMQYMVPTKRESLFTVSVTVGSVLNAGLNLILIFYFQAMGAAIASLAAETVITLLQFYMVRREISVRRIMTMGGVYLFASAVMGACILVMGGFLQPGVLSTFLMAGVGAAVYGVILWGVKEPYVMRILGKVFGNARR